MEYPYEVRTCGPSNVKTVSSLDVSIDYFDITTVFTGTLHYKIDDKEYFLSKGDTLIIRPGSHCYRFPDEHPAHYFAINYYSDGVLEADMPDLIPNCSLSYKDTTVFVDKIFKKRKTPHRNEKMSLAIKMMILALKEEIQSNVHSFHVQQILQYISENYTQNIKLDDIANHVFLTVPYCCHLIKKELGTTIYDIILHERISLAKEYLTAGTIPLSEIPYLCGFNDYSHFYKTFKKHTGINPSNFK